jgi:pimeloyl-ACP methyl ester carboxylesterase
MAQPKEYLGMLDSSTGPQSGRRRRHPALWKLIAVAALISVAVLHTHTRWHLPRACPHGAHYPSALRYEGEHISWEPCGEVKGHPLECSTIDVPMDQFNAQNSGNQTFSIPLIRMRGGQNATRNLLLNPGGPGGSGTEFIYRRGEQLRAIVGDGFHLLSFDPRGVNASRPMASCYPDAETRRERSLVRDTRVVEDSTEVYTWTHNLVRACVDTMGEHGKYLNTPQTAADMNSILDAVGQEEMVYWGFSYGSILGQTYASLFPDRAERVIIDGVANQFEWYGALFEMEAMLDTENVLSGFLEECVKAGENCALSSLAASAEDLKDKLFSFTDKLKEAPLSVYVNNTVYGTVEWESVWFGAVFPALYKPPTWYALADRLAQLLQGNATEALLAYVLDKPWKLFGDANRFITLNDGLSGADHYPQDRESLLEMLVPYMNDSLFKPTANGVYYARQQWLVPQTHNHVPSRGVRTAHPLLILSTTYDPICPLASARSANAAFEGSRVVEVKGYGHCSVAVSSMCVANHVRAFLYNGTLPDGYTQCEVDGPYFVKPEEDGKVVPLRQFDDAEEQRIHLAQVELARDWEW